MGIFGEGMSSCLGQRAVRVLRPWSRRLLIESLEDRRLRAFASRRAEPLFPVVWRALLESADGRQAYSTPALTSCSVRPFALSSETEIDREGK